jgi:hypothetical protein
MLSNHAANINCNNNKHGNYEPSHDTKSTDWRNLSWTSSAEIRFVWDTDFAVLRHGYQLFATMRYTILLVNDNIHLKKHIYPIALVDSLTHERNDSCCYCSIHHKTAHFYPYIQ